MTAGTRRDQRHTDACPVQTRTNRTAMPLISQRAEASGRGGAKGCESAGQPLTHTRGQYQANAQDDRRLYWQFVRAVLASTQIVRMMLVSTGQDWQFVGAGDEGKYKSVGASTADDSSL
eukprot:626071-Rhodomonas_salina.1